MTHPSRKATAAAWLIGGVIAAALGLYRLAALVLPLPGWW